MNVRILACIQAVVLAFSSVQTTAGTISTDNSVLVIEAEAETETETDKEFLSETETFYDMTEGDCEEVDTKTDEETLSETETEIEDVTETDEEAETETETEDEAEMVNGTETETEDEAETIDETKTKDVTETDEETRTEIENAMETKTEVDINTTQYLLTVDAVGEQLRKSLTNRETEITVYYQTTDKPDDEIAKEIWDAALEHTGNPVEGDYIRFQYESLEIPDYEITTAVSTTPENGETSTETIYYLPITYNNVS